MSARSRARRRAVEILFESEARGLPLPTVLAGRVAAADTPMNPYVTQLVEGVAAHAERIDELLATYAEGWPVERMPAVDRAVLRVGVYELLWSDAVPDPVVISEAVALADQLSTEASPTFVNGLLGRLARLKPSLSR